MRYALPLLLLVTLAPAQERRRGPAPRGIRVLRNLEYSRPGGRALHLDLYLPEKEARAPLPVVVWIHGGGWRNGSRERCPAAFLAARGFAVASIDYRLVPVARFPAQIHDCKAAIRWLRANAKRYRLDPERFGAWGSSAGGHLASLLGTSAGIAELEGDGGNPKMSSAVQAVADFCGPSDFTSWPGRPRGSAGALLGETPEQAEKNAAPASPITHVSRGDPPFFIVHGGRDNVVPEGQARRLHTALRKAGVPSWLHVIEEAGHNLHGPDTHALVEVFFERELRAGRPS